MPRRRILLLGGTVAASRLAPATASGLPIPPGGRLAFRIMRKGSQIGEHHSSFEIRDDVMTMRVDVEIVVHILGIPIFRYVHNVVEQWWGGRFMLLETRTNDDGTPYTVIARREDGGLTVSGSAQPRYIAPPDALPMTHWNRAEVTVPKINPQKGDLLRPVVADLGFTEVQNAAGALIRARRYNYSGQAILDVWFDEEGQWAGLAFLGSDQSKIMLERL
jgi:Family of unknown function (DUF6134)